MDGNTKNMKIAKNKNGDVWLFLNKPERINDSWAIDIDDYGMMQLPSEAFPHLSWEDEPIDACLIPQEELQELHNIKNKLK